MRKLFNRLVTTALYVVLLPAVPLVFMIIDGSFPRDFVKDWWQDLRYIWGFDNEY